MRISDWSSDVCSSDLPVARELTRDAARARCPIQRPAQGDLLRLFIPVRVAEFAQMQAHHFQVLVLRERPEAQQQSEAFGQPDLLFGRVARMQVRTRVESGRRVSVR